MNKFAAIASLIAASAFVSQVNAEVYRSSDKTSSAALKAAQKPASK